MELMTKELEKQMPELYAQDELGDEAMVYVKYFDIFSNWTWYGMGYDKVDNIMFGYVVGFESEFGLFSLDELAELGIRIERDLYFEPTKIGDIKKLHLVS